MWTYAAAVAWTDELASESQFFARGQMPATEVVNAILDHWGRPDAQYDWRVVVTGTAGKGTVCRKVEQILTAAGKRVTTLVSPHIQVVNERVRHDGRLISCAMYAAGMAKVKAAAEALGLRPSYFEVHVLLGILTGAEQGSEVLVGEIGIGGDKDAVNVLRGKRIAALTFVGDDHLGMFGGSREKLMEAKAGIFTDETVYGLTFDKKVYSRYIERKFPEYEYVKGIEDKLCKKVAQKICKKILKNELPIVPHKLGPARWEKVAERVILDGAHSGPRFEFLARRLQKIRRPIVGLGAMGANHDANTFGAIMDKVEAWVWTDFPSERRGHDPAWLAENFGGEVERDLKKALERAQAIAKQRDGVVLVTGSFYLCGAVREWFVPSELILEQGTEFPRILV